MEVLGENAASFEPSNCSKLRWAKVGGPTKGLMENDDTFPERRVHGVGFKLLAICI